VQLLAHCGAYWYYCDSGSVAGALLLLWLVRMSVKRAERKAKERAAARATARALADIVAKQRSDQEQAPPLF
jgi:hypothetical protein